MEPREQNAATPQQTPLGAQPPKLFTQQEVNRVAAKEARKAEAALLRTLGVGTKEDLPALLQRLERQERQAESGQSRSEQTQRAQSQSGQAESGQSESEQTQRTQSQSEQTQRTQSQSEQTQRAQSQSGQAESEQQAQPTETERLRAEKAAAEAKAAAALQQLEQQQQWQFLEKSGAPADMLDFYHFKAQQQASQSGETFEQAALQVLQSRPPAPLPPAFVVGESRLLPPCAATQEKQQWRKEAGLQ